MSSAPYEEDNDLKIEIYICDLLPGVQDEVMNALGIKTPEEANLDIVPLFVLEPDNEEENEISAG